MKKLVSVFCFLFVGVSCLWSLDTMWITKNFLDDFGDERDKQYLLGLLVSKIDEHQLIDSIVVELYDNGHGLRPAISLMSTNRVVQREKSLNVQVKTVSPNGKSETVHIQNHVSRLSGTGSQIALDIDDTSSFSHALINGYDIKLLVELDNGMKGVYDIGTDFFEEQYFEIFRKQNKYSK